MLTFPDDNTNSRPKCHSYYRSDKSAKHSTNAGTDRNALLRPNQPANK